MKSINTNKGSALAISLVILTAITLISITALQRSGLQSRMVGNIQHQEQAFHAANGELEEIFNFYATQASATQALSVPLNSFDIINNVQIFKTTSPGHTSTYSSYTPSKKSPRLRVNSNIEHTGFKSALVDGFSVGTFSAYEFVVTSEAAQPNIGQGIGRVLSSQAMGIKYIAPAG